MTASALWRDRIRRIVGEEMHAVDDRVAGDDDLLAFGRPQHGGIVPQPERGGVRGERREIAGDDLELAETLAWRLPLPSAIAGPFGGELLRPRFVREPVENAVHDLRLFLGEEGVRDVDIFGDDHARRHVARAIRIS